MEHITVKKKIDRLIISHKIDKTEQINSMELDIINRAEIPALLPVQILRTLRGKKIRFVVESLSDLRAYLKSNLQFDHFADIILQIVDTIQACESHGIRCGNLELNCDLSYYDYNHKRVRMIYWPLISLSEYSNVSAYFMELGSVYTTSSYDSEFRMKYLKFFDTRAQFDLERFRQYVEKLTKEWQEKQVGRVKTEDPYGGKKPDGPGPTVALMTATLHRKSTQNNITISRYPFTIGRIAKFCDYAVEEDGAISKRHVTILLRNGQAYIRDNASTNGTKINGLPIPPNTDVELPSGATFQIGKEEFVFYAAGGCVQ